MEAIRDKEEFAEQLAAKSIGELRAVAREHGMPMASRLSKQQIVNSLLRQYNA